MLKNRLSYIAFAVVIALLLFFFSKPFLLYALVAQAEASADFELAPVFLRVPAVWMHVRNQGTAYTIKGQYGYGQP